MGDRITEFTVIYIPFNFPVTMRASYREFQLTQTQSARSPPVVSQSTFLAKPLRSDVYCKAV